MPYRTLTAPASLWPPTFAESFIDQARALLDVRGVLVVVGAVDGSCQRLASDIVAVPQQNGRLWSTHVARFGDRERPLHAVRQIFCAVRLQHLDTVETIEAAVRDDLVAGGDRPTVIVSNAGECDPESLVVLTRLAGAGLLRLIVTMTNEAAAAHGQLLTRSEVIELPPLANETIAEMIRARWGAVPDAQVVDDVIERTGGSYDVICEVIDAACLTQRLVVEDDRLVSNPDRPVMTGLDGDDDLIQLVSILGRVDLAEARTRFGAETTDRAVERGVLRADDGRLSFVSPSEGTRTFWLLSRERLTALFDRHASELPATLSDPANAVAAAEWMLSAGQLLPKDLAVSAARRANLAGQHLRAVVFTAPDNVDGHVAVAPAERAVALREIGDEAALQATWTSVDPQTLDEDELLPYLCWLEQLTDVEARESRLQRAVHGQDGESSQRRATVQNLAAVVERALNEGSDDVAAHLRTLAFSSPMTGGNRAVTFACLSATLRNSGRPAQAVEMAGSSLQLLEEEAELSSFHIDLAREIHILALVSALDLDAAEQAIEAYESGPTAGTGRLASALRSLLELDRGDIEAAVSQAQLCLTNLQRHDPHGVRGWVEALLAQMWLHLERPEEVRTMLQLSQQHPCRRAPLDLERRTAQAAVLDQLAEPEEALELLQDVIGEARLLGLREVHIEAAALSVQVGGPAHLSGLLEAVNGLDEASGVPAVWQAFAHTAHDYDIPALTALAEQLAARGTFLLAGRIAQFVLDMSRRATDLDGPTRTRLGQLAELDAEARALPAFG